MKRWPALILIALLRAPSAAAVASIPELPPLLTGNESAATTEGVEGFLFNPAAVGLRYPSELLVSFIRPSSGTAGEINHELLSFGGFGLEATRIKDRAQLYGFSLAGGNSHLLRLGFTSAVEVSDLTNTRVWDHRLGVLTRPTPWLSIAGVCDHVFQPALDGTRFGRIYDVALGLRPLALSRSLAHDLGTRLTLNGDLLIAENGARGQARVRIGAEFEPVPGLALRGSFEDHGGMHIGLTLRGPRASLSGQRGSVNGTNSYDSYTASIHRGEDRSALAGPADRRVAVVKIGGHLGDEPLGGVSLIGGSGGNTAVAPIEHQLERALDDPLTRGVLIELDGASNMAALEELRPRIARLRAAGKPVVAYLENGGGRSDLYLASACTRIVSTEEAQFMALGLRVEHRYYRKLLADWGVRFDRSSYGPYKSAFRNLSVDSTTAPDRVALERTLGVLQDTFVEQLVADRGVDTARVSPILDGRAWPASELRKAGLIDSVGYRELALALVGGLAGLGSKPHEVNLSRSTESHPEWNVPTRIAVVYASGGIDLGRSGNDLLLGPYMGATSVVRQLEHAFRNPSVRAVVLRVESPGGSGLASNLIDHALQRLKHETGKPLIVSMGEVAASGGYYISCHADRIYADRFTYTGAIGVLFVKPSIEGWLAKHGVRQDEFEYGRYMRGTSLGRDWDAAIQASADSSTRAYYRGFVRKVAEGRGVPYEEIELAARGRVWLGDDALERKLVDSIGGLDAAIAEARRRAQVPEREKIQLAEYRRPSPGLLERLAGHWVSDLWSRSVHLPEPGEIYYYFDADDEAGP